MEFLNKYHPKALSLLRIMAGLLFMEGGCAKVFHWPYAQRFADVVIGAWPEGVSGPFELVLGLLIALGLFSRIAAFLASGEMAIGYFIGHVIPHGTLLPVVNGGDLAVLYCFVFFYLFFAGPGPWALNRR